MKIVHICLCGAMTDGMNYQENILSKYHRIMGNEVVIIASRYVWDKKGQITITDRNNYINQDGVKVIRLKNYFGNINSKFKIYRDLFKSIKNEDPDILFIHDAQFLDLLTLKNYIKKRKQIRVFIDNHVDYYNGAHGWLSKHILHKGLWRFCIKQIEPYVEFFYGVLPARVDFLKELYKLPESKCKLLIMGGDDEYVKLANDDKICQMRKQNKIDKDDFLIVSGGKINAHRPEIISLMKAIGKCEKRRIKLIVFGSVSKEYYDEFQKCLCLPNVQYVGWLEAKETYILLKSANLVCFPGMHSVMWEQAVALGVPCVFKDIEGFHHVDIGGNAIFLKNPNEENLKNTICDLWDNPQKMKELSTHANGILCKEFLYSRIAEESIK